MRLAGWRRLAHEHSAETKPADGQGPKSGALHEGALANLCGGAASWIEMALLANSRAPPTARSAARRETGPCR
jgi:hypothetical protein